MTAENIAATGLYFCSGCGRDILPPAVRGRVWNSAVERPEGLDHVTGPDVSPCGPVQWATFHPVEDGVLLVSEHGEILDARREPRERFRVHDRDTAEWALRRISDAEHDAAAKRARLKILVANAEKEISRLDADAKTLRYRFEDELERWTVGEVAGGRRRSVVTPWGTVGFRKSRGSTVIEDEDAAIAWAVHQAPDAVQTTVRLLVSGLPKGVEVPGVRRVEPVDRFFVDSGAE